LLEEQDNAGNIVARYVYGRGLVSRQDGAGNLSVYHFDSLGSTVALTNQSGAITDRYAYDPFGRIVGRTGTADNPFTFNGRDGVVDDGNGLYFMRVRFYAPELMRFIQKDQVFDGVIVVTQSLNRHAFAMGNPVQFVDPNGDVDEEQASWLLAGIPWVASAIVLGTMAGPIVAGLAILGIAIAFFAAMDKLGVDVDWSKLCCTGTIGWVLNLVDFALSEWFDVEMIKSVTDWWASPPVELGKLIVKVVAAAVWDWLTFWN
jgi:RHS repeat-associated protein